MSDHCTVEYFTKGCPNCGAERTDGDVWFFRYACGSKYERNSDAAPDVLRPCPREAVQYKPAEPPADDADQSDKLKEGDEYEYWYPKDPRWQKSVGEFSKSFLTKPSLTGYKFRPVQPKAESAPSAEFIPNIGDRIQEWDPRAKTWGNPYIASAIRSQYEKYISSGHRYRLAEQEPPAKEPVDPASDVPDGWRELRADEKDYSYGEKWIEGGKHKTINGWIHNPVRDDAGCWAIRNQRIIVPITASDGWRMLGEDEILERGDEVKWKYLNQWFPAGAWEGRSLSQVPDGKGCDARTKRPIPAVEELKEETGTGTLVWGAKPTLNEPWFPDKGEWAQGKRLDKSDDWSEPFQAAYPRDYFARVCCHFEYRPWSPPVESKSKPEPEKSMTLPTPPEGYRLITEDERKNPPHPKALYWDVMNAEFKNRRDINKEKPYDCSAVTPAYAVPIEPEKIITTGTGDCYSAARQLRAAMEEGDTLYTGVFSEEWKNYTVHGVSEYSAFLVAADGYAKGAAYCRFEPLDKQDSPNQNTNTNPTKTMATTSLGQLAQLPALKSRWILNSAGGGITRKVKVRSASTQGVYVTYRQGVIFPDGELIALDDWNRRIKTPLDSPKVEGPCGSGVYADADRYIPRAPRKSLIIRATKWTLGKAAWLALGAVFSKPLTMGAIAAVAYLGSKFSQFVGW